MKKIKVVKAMFLFLLILCVISIFIVVSRQTYFENKENEIIKNVESILEDVKDENSELIQEQENWLIQNEVVGIILIPSIDVKAPIYEGTSLDVLKYTVRTF